MSISRTERKKFFGKPGRRGSASKQIVRVNLGFDLRMAGEYAGKSMNVSAHRLIAEHFRRAITEAARVSGWMPRRIGSYNPRRIRGSWRWSMHAYGLAWDIFRTPYGETPEGDFWTPKDEVPAAFVKVMQDHGFTWGGGWKRRDTPHFEWGGGPVKYTTPGVQRSNKFAVILPTLMPGDEESTVRKMQGLLVAHVLTLSGEMQSFVDGDYGEITERVFRQWQDDRDLKVDGICGPKSWGALVNG